MPSPLNLYKDTPIMQKLPVIVVNLNHWQRMAFGLRFVHALLGTMAIIFSLLAAAQIGSIADEYAKIFALIAAISIGLMTGFNLSEKSNNVRNAWRHLSGFVIAYNNGKASEEDVIEAYKKGEDLIGDVTFSRSS